MNDPTTLPNSRARAVSRSLAIGVAAFTCFATLDCAHTTNAFEDDTADAEPDDARSPIHNDAAAANDASGGDGAAVDPCGSDGHGRMLACATNCPDSLFQTTALVTDFSGTQTYATDWSGSYVTPTVISGGLQFGPHPIPAPNWWSDYSPTDSTRTDFGDVMMCLRFSMHVDGSVDAATASNGFQISLRGGSEGMVLSFGGSTQVAVLTTKVDADNSWVEHARTSFPLSTGDHVLEMALAGSGNDFYAEIKDVDSGAVAPLHASYGLPSSGGVEMLAYEVPQALVVSRVVVGAPAASAWARLIQP